MLNADNARAPEICPVCTEISERSRTYGRWLVNENYGDGATLRRVTGARGFCSGHARKLLEADTAAAASVARFVLRAIANDVRAQLTSTRGYRGALDPQEPCPWCVTEFNALEAALDVRRGGLRELCQPHARSAAAHSRTQRILLESPQPPCPVLAPPVTRAGVLQTSWWAPSVEELWRALLIACPSCIAARDAEAKREAFLRRGPLPGEHWDVPTLCVTHDALLGWPRTAAFVHESHDTTLQCVCCTVVERAVARTAELAAIALSNAAFREAYAHVDGFCLPHTRYVLSALGQRARRDAAARSALERIEALVWELDESSARGSWGLRDQGAGDFASDLPHRAWWLLAGGSARSFEDGARR